MKKIEEVTCIKFQEKSENNHQERVLYNGGSQSSFIKNLKNSNFGTIFLSYF